MIPVINDAGVTSKAGLRAGDSSGTVRTRMNSPESDHPHVKRTSSSPRSSIGIAVVDSEPEVFVVLPSCIVNSLVADT